MKPSSALSITLITLAAEILLCQSSLGTNNGAAMLLPFVVQTQEQNSVVPKGSMFVAKITPSLNSRGAGRDFTDILKSATEAQLLNAEPDSIWIRVSDSGLENLAKTGFFLSHISQEDSFASKKRSLSAASIAGQGIKDSDGDGLTDTEETWWGTDPYNPSTVGDGISDSQRIQRARAGDHSIGIPWPDWPSWGHSMDANHWMSQGRGLTTPIVDLDMDCIPDAAERFILGFNPYKESTDNDRYDDGQEFWGITQNGRGPLPRAVDSNFLLSEMPAFVDSPGSSPLCAAYPNISVSVLEGSIKLSLRQTIKTENKEVNEREFIYETEVTEENSIRSLSETSLRSLERKALSNASQQDQQMPMDVFVRIEYPDAQSSSHNWPGSGQNPFNNAAYGLVENAKSAYYVSKLIPDTISLLYNIKTGDVCKQIINGINLTTTAENINNSFFKGNHKCPAISPTAAIG